MEKVRGKRPVAEEPVGKRRKTGSSSHSKGAIDIREAPTHRKYVGSHSDDDDDDETLGERTVRKAAAAATAETDT